MEYFIQESKYEAETISIVVSFLDLFSSGEIISGLPAITVTLFTGTDPSPSNILYGVADIVGNVSVSQKIRLGVPGVIYHITFKVATNLGNTFEKETCLAILPEDATAIPLWLPVWESTQLYPYMLQDGVSAGQVLTGGRLAQTVYTIPSEGIFPVITMLSGVLTYLNNITYNIPHEDISALHLLQSGILTYINNAQYDIPHEDIKTFQLLIGGSLNGVGVSYIIPSEGISTAQILTGGTLT